MPSGTHAVKEALCLLEADIHLLSEGSSRWVYIEHHSTCDGGGMWHHFLVDSTFFFTWFFHVRLWSPSTHILRTKRKSRSKLDTMFLPTPWASGCKATPVSAIIHPKDPLTWAYADTQSARVHKPYIGGREKLFLLKEDKNFQAVWKNWTRSPLKTSWLSIDRTTGGEDCERFARRRNNPIWCVFISNKPGVVFSFCHIIVIHWTWCWFWMEHY